jgi:hypothetical protein
MNRILLAAVAAIGFAGAAVAQEPPVFQGNFSAAVADAHNGAVSTGSVGVTGTAAIAGPTQRPDRTPDRVYPDRAYEGASDLYSIFSGK